MFVSLKKHVPNNEIKLPIKNYTKASNFNILTKHEF